MGLHRFLLVVLLAAAGPAFAKKKVVVDAPRPFNTLIFNALIKKGYKPVGAKHSLSRMPLTKEIQKACKPSGAVAIARGRIAGRTWQLQVFTAHDGAPVATSMFKVQSRNKKRIKRLPKNTLFELYQGVAQGRPAGWRPRAERAVAAADAPTADEEIDTPSSASDSDDGDSVGDNDIRLSFDDDEGDSAGAPAMRASLGFRGFNRSFGYAGNPSASLATYNLGFAPAVALDAQWYPGTHLTRGVGANAGVFVQGDMGVGVASRQDASRFSTRADRFRFGALMRFPVGALEPQVHLGYSTQTFAISENAANDGQPRPNIPSVTFNGPRAGGSVRLALFDRFSLDAGGGVTYVYGKGELASQRYFPNATAFAADASAGVAFKLVKNIELRAGADWSRYFVDLHPAEGSALTAKSASDQYVGGTVSLSWVM